MIVSVLAALALTPWHSAWFQGDVAWAAANGVPGFTEVSGSWVQPAIGTAPGTVDLWAGVTVESDRLLQAGTEATAVDGAATYFAWITAWTGQPGQTIIVGSVSPGDHISVTLDRAAPGHWTVTVADAGHWTVSRIYAWSATGLDAGWFAEDPATWTGRRLTPAQVGSVTVEATARSSGVGRS